MNGTSCNPITRINLQNSPKVFWPQLVLLHAFIEECTLYKDRHVCFIMFQNLHKKMQIIGFLFREIRRSRIDCALINLKEPRSTSVDGQKRNTAFSSLHDNESEWHTNMHHLSAYLFLKLVIYHYPQHKKMTWSRQQQSLPLPHTSR